MPKSKPIRVFDGSAQPYEPFWRVRNAADADGGEPEIEFYGYISEYSWLEDDITPAKFKDDLYKAGQGGPVTVRINSGGGEVFAASVIRSILVDYPGRVTVRIDGLCASAATFVAMAGDWVKMQDTAYFMIHDPSALAWGTIDEVERVLDLLKTIKSGIVDAYAGKTQLSLDKLSRMMTAETWLSARQAKDMGFIDEVIGGPTTSMAQAAFTNALRSYQNVPDAVVAMCQAHPVENIGDEPQPNLAAERLRAEVKLLV